MGLDMYLYARLHTSEYFAPAANQELRSVADRYMPPAAQTHDSIVIERQAAYWRKANAIHQWFVENVQDGKDECQQADVSLDKLKELYQVCIAVRDGVEMVDGIITNGWVWRPGENRKPITQRGQRVANPGLAKRLLPTQGGFFFGSTDYDEFYLSDINDTIEQLDRVFAWVEANKNDRGYTDIDFYYQASW